MSEYAIKIIRDKKGLRMHAHPRKKSHTEYILSLFRNLPSMPRRKKEAFCGQLKIAWPLGFHWAIVSQEKGVPLIIGLVVQISKLLDFRKSNEMFSSKNSNQKTGGNLF